MSEDTLHEKLKKAASKAAVKLAEATAHLDEIFTLNGKVYDLEQSIQLPRETTMLPMKDIGKHAQEAWHIFMCDGRLQHTPEYGAYCNVKLKWHKPDYPGILCMYLPPLRARPPYFVQWEDGRRISNEDIDCWRYAPSQDIKPIILFKGSAAEKPQEPIDPEKIKKPITLMDFVEQSMATNQSPKKYNIVWPPNKLPQERAWVRFKDNVEPHMLRTGLFINNTFWWLPPNRMDAVEAPLYTVWAWKPKFPEGANFVTCCFETVTWVSKAEEV